MFHWLPTAALTDDGTLPMSFGEHIDDKLNGYVLSPHCEGYTVERDRQPAVLRDVTALPDVWLADDSPTTTADTTGPADAGDDPVGVYDVLSPASYPVGERTAHPFHPSATGTNFMVDGDTDTFRCWRHDVTGSGSHLLGIEQGVLDCGDWDGREIPTATWREIYNSARADGYDIPPPATDGGDDGGPDVRTVWGHHADAITDADSPRARLDAARPVFEAMARAELRAHTDGEPEVWLAELDAIGRMVPKTQYRERYETVRASVREELPDDVLATDATPLDVWLAEHVERVVVYSSPDAHADAEYRWKLNDGRQFATGGRTHFRWQELQTVIFNSIGARPAKPNPADSEAWANWVMEFINDNREEKPKWGPRSQAIERLADEIRAAIAYPTPEAITRGGRSLNIVWMDGPDADTVQVWAKDIRHVAEEFGIEPRHLQIELDDRGLRTGQSEPVRFDDGRSFRFWPISTELAEPASFKPELPDPL